MDCAKTRAGMGPLSGLDLSSLSLRRTQVRSLQPLAGMERLRSLAVVGSPIGDLSALATMPSLVTVAIDASRHAAVRFVREDVRVVD